MTWLFSGHTKYKRCFVFSNFRSLSSHFWINYCSIFEFLTKSYIFCRKNPNGNNLPKVPLGCTRPRCGGRAGCKSQLSIQRRTESSEERNINYNCLHQCIPMGGFSNFTITASPGVIFLPLRPCAHAKVPNQKVCRHHFSRNETIPSIFLVPLLWHCSGHIRWGLSWSAMPRLRTFWFLIWQK